ncbi:hypothetical protein DYB26_015861, partial [Aphanomyces astaci]
MEPNGTGESGATMERNKVSTKGKASKEAPPMAKSVATASTYGKAKFNSTPKITTTVWQLPNTAADGEQSLPDAWSEARRELLQRIQLAYPSDSEEETKDDPDVASRLLLSYIRQYGIGGDAEYADRIAVPLQLAMDQELDQPPKHPAPESDVSTNVAKRTKTRRGAKLAASAAKKKEYRQSKRAKKSQMLQADEEPQVEHFLMEFVPAQHPIIPEGPVLSRGEMAALDVELNPRPIQPLNDSEALQDEIDFVEGVLDDIDLHPTLEPYPFQPLEDPTAIHREVQFIEEALHDIDLGEDPPFFPHDPVQDAIQVRPPCRSAVNYVGRQSYEVFEEGGHTRLHVPEKTKTCPHCRAKLTPHDYKNLPCCLKGKVKVDPYVFPDSPEMQAFKDLFKQRNFIEHIRQYNAQFNFTSIGTNEVRHSGSGPKTYCIQGQLT